MKLPNWFKIVWWIILLGLTSTILYKRFEAITSGQSVTTDIFIFLLFVALMLVPIFSEIEFFGIKLKKEIDDLKNEIRIKFGDIKSEIRANQAQTFNATIQGFGPPPPDNKLPELENEIDRIVKQKLKENGVQADIEVPDYNLQMFKVRYNIETQVRRIWEERFKEKNLSERVRHQPVFKILQDLTQYEIIENNFYGILREILSICNYAIHGETVTANQVEFVNKNSKEVIEYLAQLD